MPIGFLSDAERERLDGFPTQIIPGDIETYFTLSRSDRAQIPRTTSAANRLGFALQLVQGVRSGKRFTQRSRAVKFNA